MLSFATVCWLAGIYIFFALVTFGFLYRNGRPGLRRRVLQAGMAAIWPLYWLVVHGVTGTVVFIARQVGIMLNAVSVGLVTAFEPLVPALQWIWAVGLVLFPAFYLATQWGACSGWGCLTTLVFSLIWAPFWPVYAVVHYLM